MRNIQVHQKLPTLESLQSVLDNNEKLFYIRYDVINLKVNQNESTQNTFVCIYWCFFPLWDSIEIFLLSNNDGLSK